MTEHAVNKALCDVWNERNVTKRIELTGGFSTTLTMTLHEEQTRASAGAVQLTVQWFTRSRDILDKLLAHMSADEREAFVEAVIEVLQDSGTIKSEDEYKRELDPNKEGYFPENPNTVIWHFLTLDALTAAHCAVFAFGKWEDDDK